MYVCMYVNYTIESVCRHREHLLKNGGKIWRTARHADDFLLFVDGRWFRRQEAEPLGSGVDFLRQSGLSAAEASASITRYDASQMLHYRFAVYRRNLSANFYDFNPLTPTVARWGAAIKHPVSDRVKLSFVIFDIRAL